MSDIASWLRELGLAKYASAFTSNDIDLETVRDLRESDLRELGLTLGARRKVMKAINALRDEVGSAGERRLAREAARTETQAERRQLTIMFVDLAGSTQLSQQLDPEEMRDVIRSYQTAVSSAITKHRGQVAKLMGDGVLAYFGWPRAQENDAERAVRAGLEVSAAVADLVTPSAQRLSARVGIATGLVVVGDVVGEGSAQEEAVVGETPNLAARLQALANPDTVVISDTTHRLVSGLFEVEDLGPLAAKGFAKPVRAWRVSGVAALEKRFEALHRSATPLVGRAEELQVALGRWRQAKSGKGQVLLLSGEPGIGKSRLIAVLQEHIGSDPHARLAYFCSAHFASSPLYPVIEQLRRGARIVDHDNAVTKLNKLRTSVSRTGSDFDELAPFLSELLSIDTAGRYAPGKLSAPARKTRTLQVLIELLKGLAARRPVLMVVEDAHWIDPTTNEWVEMAIRSCENLPILLVISFRSEFRPPWAPCSYMTALSLDRLSDDHGVEIAEGVAGGKVLPEEVLRQIVAKTEGIPLFVEELTRTILESGALSEAGDRYLLSRPLTAFQIPLTLQDSLMARLDRLGAAKAVAQTGACLGRVFSHRLLAAVMDSNHAEMAGALQQLEESELLFRQGEPPDAVYTFKHALVQDAAYQSLLKSRRQQLHALIATTLEKHFPEIAGAEPETLARHFTTASLAEQAISYWLKAGRQALRRSANIEAIRHLEQGMELTSLLPKSEGRLRHEIELQSALGVTLITVKGWGAPEVLQAFSKARTLSQELGDEHQMFIALCGEASYHMISGHLRESDRLGRQCVELAREAGDPNLVLEAHHRQWATKYFLGEYDAAEMHANAGISSYHADLHHSLTYVYTGHDPGVCCRVYSGAILWLRGYPDQALLRCQDALRLARQVGHPLSTQLAQFRLSTVHALRGEVGDARLHVEQSIALAREFGFALSISEGEFHLGRVLTETGNRSEGIQLMRKALEAIRKTGAAVALQEYLCTFGLACSEADIEQGLDLIEQALRIAQAGTAHQLPEILRAKGELLLRLDPGDRTAEDLFRQAIETARVARTRSLELKAALSLAHLHQGHGLNEEARKVLAPIYGWFTEGHGTHDLNKARAVLQHLEKQRQ
jgi:class 3 adenylate cyclase/tetratricopeptide (TPR) repeat protein